MVEKSGTGIASEKGSFKAGELDVLDFQDIIGAFSGSSSESFNGDETVGDISMEEIRNAEESFEFGLDNIEEEVDLFLEESERAGRLSNILYVPDQYYDNLPESSEGRVEVGAIDGTIPVRVLPMEQDLFHRLNRFSFGEDMKEILEGEQTAVLVNPSGEETYEGRAYVEIGEDIARDAYERAVSEQNGLEYLKDVRGVGVADIDQETVEIQIDETKLGREFDYRISEDALVLEMGDDTVEVPYDGEVYDGAVDRDTDRVHDPRKDEDAKVYKFVVE